MAARVDATSAEIALCKKSLYHFVKRFWFEVEHVQPVWNWHIRVICDALQEGVERVINNLPREHDILINVPPSSSKSIIASVMLPAWAWCRKPELQFICASYTDKLAKFLALKSRQIIEGKKWRRLFGDIRLRDDSSAVGLYHNQNGGFRFATSLGGTATGFHGDVLVIDDPLNPKEAASEVELQNANRLVTETLPTRKVNQVVSLTAMIMQRLHHQDPSAEMLLRDDVKHICLPAELTDDVRPRVLARNYVDDLLDPVRLPWAVLENMREHVLHEYAYAGQMLQSPSPREGGTFKTQNITIDDAPPNHRIVKWVRAWDKAGTLDDGAWTVGLRMAVDVDGRVWVFDVKRAQLDSGAREKLIKVVAEADGKGIPVALEQEPGSGGKESAQNTVRMLLGWSAKAHLPTGSKEARAQPFATQVNIGNVSLVRAPWNVKYLNELAAFPLSTYKDQVDASSLAFTDLTERTQVGILDHWS